MSAILGHYTRSGVKIVSKWIPFISEGLSSYSLKYFERTFILCSDNLQINANCVVNCSLTIRQLLKRVVCMLLNSPIKKFNASNVLTFGYQKSFADGEIQNLFPNHLHNHFFIEPWIELHKFIGDDNMILLLTECSIFISLPESNNLLQIAGKPLSEESVKIPSNFPITSSSFIYITRSKILYGKQVSARNENIIGLPFKHLLNINVKSSILTESIFNFSNNTKSSWQFRRLKSLADEFLKGHLKCPYLSLYNYYTKSTRGPLIPYQVFGFLVSVLKRVLPNDFAKNRTFMKHLRKKLWIFLKLTRFEKMSTNELVLGLSIKEIAVIFDPKTSSKNAIQSPGEHEKFKELIKNFMYFIFENFIVDLLKSNFYITETANSRSRLVFYRHDTWNSLTGPILEAFHESMFQPLHTSVNLVKSLSKARCRLVPKDNGKFRPIMAFKKPPSTEEGNRLRASFDILKYFYELDSGLSVSGFAGLQAKLLQYKSTCKSAGPFYLAKLDISSCFDSIPHGKLFSLLASLLQKKEFYVRRVDQVQLDLINNRSVKRINRIARSTDTGNCNRPGLNSASVTVDRVAGKFHSGEAIFRIIYDHLSNNIVQINDKLFRQKKGIPQGSFLSTLLCSLFYSQFDRETGLIDFPSDDLVMRYIDDFLIISPCRERLERFIEYLQSGFPEFGIIINKEKTRFSAGMPFTWCGLRIDPKTLDISPDYTNFEGTNISDAITARERTSKAGQALMRQLQYFLRPKLKKLFHQNNSQNTIIYNLIQGFAMVSIKLHAYLRDLPHKMTNQYLRKCVMQVIKYCCKLVRLRYYPDLIKSLAWNTFYAVLRRKGTVYKQNGFLDVLKKASEEEFPLPRTYEALLKSSLEPFYERIKY